VSTLFVIIAAFLIFLLAIRKIYSFKWCSWPLIIATIYAAIDIFANATHKLQLRSLPLMFQFHSISAPTNANENQRDWRYEIVNGQWKINKFTLYYVAHSNTHTHTHTHDFFLLYQFIPTACCASNLSACIHNNSAATTTPYLDALISNNSFARTGIDQIFFSFHTNIHLFWRSHNQ
jgi:hypothetical protein